MLKKFTILIMAAAVAMPAFATEKAAEVTSAKGRVEIVHGDAVMGKKADLGSELIVQDILRTKRRGYAEVGFVDGTNVKVFEKSRLTINGIDRTFDGYNAEIQKGKVLFNVEKMEDVAGDFRVKTTNSIIGVKGTTFGVVSGGLVTIVEVYNGNVEVLATASEADFEAGKVDVGSLEGAGKGGDAEQNKGTLVANLNSGQGLVLSSSGDVQVYEFDTGGSGKSLIFKGPIPSSKPDDKAEDDDNGGTAEGGDDGSGDGGDSGSGTGASSGSGDSGGIFGSLGAEEEAEAGGDSGDSPYELIGSGAGEGDTPSGEGSDLPAGLESLSGNDIPGAPQQEGGAGDLPGAGQDPLGDLLGGQDPTEDIKDIVDEGNEFYSDPDVRPDTEEQVDLATGIVNININFK